MNVNNFYSFTLNNPKAMQLHSPIINLSAAVMSKNASDNIASTFYNWVPMECQQFLCWLNMLCSNELHCIVPKLSVMWSVFSICLCIQLHKSVCNLSQIWLFLLVALQSIFKNPHSTLLLPILAVSWIGEPRCQIPTAMPDWKSLNTTLVGAMISSKNQHVFICDLSDLTLQIIFDASWASINACSKRGVPWNHSRHTPLWRFYLHCWIE